MALNKSMHARNRYKDKPPDFAYLASKYPDFKQHVQINLTGRVSLNFKDPEAVRALTCTLLKEDFGLSIDIPLERLIPTVPLRLNYIHWVEDLIGPWDPARSALRRGIDIGISSSLRFLLRDFKQCFFTSFFAEYLLKKSTIEISLQSVTLGLFLPLTSLKQPYRDSRTKALRLKMRNLGVSLLFHFPYWFEHLLSFTMFLGFGFTERSPVGF